MIVQALSFCKECVCPTDCDFCPELHEWIMEALEEKAELQAYRDTGMDPEDEDKGGKLIKASDAAEALSEKLNIPMADLVDLFAEIPGVTADRLKSLAQADRDGRLVVLPCKVGDTVYFTLLGRIIEKPVFSIVSFSTSARIYCAGTSEYFRPEDFGKTVFLTRKEAEASMKGGDAG